jgi:hypothetical protein
MPLILENAQRAIDKSAAQRISIAPKDDWTPLSLHDVDLKAEPYPINALPPILRDAVIEVQAFVQAPISIVALAGLAELALAGQGQANIKRDEKLISPCSIFGIVIAGSGERKTTLDVHFASVIRKYEAEKREEAKSDIAAYQADLQAWQSKKAGKLEAIKAASKANKSTQTLEDDLLGIEKSKPIEPKVTRLIYGDVTSEQLAYSLAKNWPSGAIISSEAGVVFGGHAMGSDSVIRNLSVLNVLWDGGTHTVDRRTSDSFTIKNARLTLSLAIQKETLLEFLKKNGDLARGSGFIARFLIAYPESNQGFRQYKEPPKTWTYSDRFNRRILEILEMPIQFDETGNGLEPTILGLSDDAKKCWIEFFNIIEGQLKQGGELSIVRDVASKSADNAARIAGLFHLLQYGKTGLVNEQDMKSACAIAMWHLSESQRFLSEVSQSPEVNDAILLNDWLVKYCNTHQTNIVKKSYVLQHAPNQLRNKAKLASALDELIDANRVKLFSEENAMKIEINQQILEKK